MSGVIESKYFLAALFIFCFFEVTYHVYVTETITEKMQDAVNKLMNSSKKDGRMEEISVREFQCEKPIKLTNLNDFFNYGKTNGKADCVNIAIIGGHTETYNALYPYNEGARTVCLDGMKKDDCVVLSFDVGKDYSFDNDVEYIAGCKVYMFNPLGVKSFKRPPNMEFYNIGLSDKKETTQIANHLIQVDRFEGILDMLNLTKQSIDYLKIDIEGSELNFFRDVFDTSVHLLENVKQIGMEIHPIFTNTTSDQFGLVTAFQPYWDAMRRLECLGFDLISFVPSLLPACKFDFLGEEISGCFDVVFSKRISQVFGLK